MSCSRTQYNDPCQGLINVESIVLHVNGNGNGNFCSGNSTKGLFIHRFHIKLEFRSVDFCGGRKTREHQKKPLKTRMRTNNKLNPQTMPGLESNPGHIGGRRAFSPLHHPCSPIGPPCLSSYRTLQIAENSKPGQKL